MNIKVCHICLKPLRSGKDIAAAITPRGSKTRYYCGSCIQKEIMIASGSSPLLEANYKEVNNEA